ncbi:hypothetical protein ACSL103130_06450 [Actinomyces slackii]|uniref:Uncharacterized protein n=2 Tax=Actinomyces slackii TaxID=52774 RepID=A0A3S4SEG7_9ACTO|nr:Uncharacterised protein [Actinomyces slackii]
MPTFAQYHAELQALSNRMTVYLDRMEARAREFGAQAKQTAAELQATDPNSVATFRMEIHRQIMFLHTKAERAYEQYISPYEDLEDDDDLSMDEFRVLRNLTEDIEHEVDSFEDRMDAVIEDIFAAGQANQTRQEWDRAIAEWRAAQSSFTCSQCGAPVALPELYHVAVYVTCGGCGSRVTFQPSEAMRAAPRWAEELADAECADLKRTYEAGHEGGGGMDFVSYVYYLTSQFRVLSRLLPFYARSLAPQMPGKIRAAWEDNTDQLTPHEVSPRHYETEYLNVMGNIGVTAMGMRASGHTEHLALILGVVRDVMRPGDPLAQSILDGTFTEEMWDRRQAAADRMSDAVPR